jgi:hypothetical protein
VQRARLQQRIDALGGCDGWRILLLGATAAEPHRCQGAVGDWLAQPVNSGRFAAN